MNFCRLFCDARRGLQTVKPLHHHVLWPAVGSRGRCCCCRSFMKSHRLNEIHSSNYKDGIPRFLPRVCQACVTLHCINWIKQLNSTWFNLIYTCMSFFFLFLNLKFIFTARLIFWIELWSSGIECVTSCPSSPCIQCVYSREIMLSCRDTSFQSNSHRECVSTPKAAKRLWLRPFSLNPSFRCNKVTSRLFHSFSYI